MSYQDAMERAIELRLRAKKEEDTDRKDALLLLALEWEAWAETCRDGAQSGAHPDPSGRPADDI